MVFLETWGSTTYPPTKWEGWGYAEENYAPEWLSKSDLDGVEPDMCVTVLHAGFSAPKAPVGYRVAYQWTVGERECPWCGPGTGNEHTRPSCELCNGDGLLYWGEDWQGVVFAPLQKHYVYGARA